MLNEYDPAPHRIHFFFAKNLFHKLYVSKVTVTTTTTENNDDRI